MARTGAERAVDIMADFWSSNLATRLTTLAADAPATTVAGQSLAFAAGQIYRHPPIAVANPIGLFLWVEDESDPPANRSNDKRWQGVVKHELICAVRNTADYAATWVVAYRFGQAMRDLVVENPYVSTSGVDDADIVFGPHYEPVAFNNGLLVSAQIDVRLTYFVRSLEAE